MGGGLAGVSIAAAARLLVFRRSAPRRSPLDNRAHVALATTSVIAEAPAVRPSSS